MAGLSRYRNSNKLNNGQYLETFDFPAQEDLNAIDTIQVLIPRFERLDNLAFKHFGNAEYWWVISLFNPSLAWPFAIEEGTIIQIPTNIQKVLELF